MSNKILYLTTIWLYAFHLHYSGMIQKCFWKQTKVTGRTVYIGLEDLNLVHFNVYSDYKYENKNSNYLCEHCKVQLNEQLQNGAVLQT